MSSRRSSTLAFSKLGSTWASDHLNLIRGVAAIAVLAAHVRWRLFLEYTDAAEHGLLQRAFYAVTACGHDAVMVFFVLSGFLISTSVMRDGRNHRWSFASYLTSRCVRLYVVLVPGLLLTALWDWIGLTYFGNNAVYSGDPQSFHHFYFPVASRFNLETFFGNLSFLQMVLVPPFGSNEALWSLSYEWWFYLLFPCLWFAIFYKPAKLSERILYLGGGLVLVLVLPKNLLLYFPVWLLGTLVGLLPASGAIRRHRTAMVAAMAVVVVGTLGLTHWSPLREAVGGSMLVLDCFNACAFACLLYTLLHCNQPSGEGKYAAFSRSIAGCSYTLYVVHLPLLVLLHALLIADRPWNPDAAHIGLGIVIACATFACAWALSRVTEAKTDAVRKWITGRSASQVLTRAT